MTHLCVGHDSFTCVTRLIMARAWICRISCCINMCTCLYMCVWVHACLIYVYAYICICMCTCMCIWEMHPYMLHAYKFVNSLLYTHACVMYLMVRACMIICRWHEYTKTHANKEIKHTRKQKNQKRLSISHVPHMKESDHTFERVTPHTQASTERSSPRRPSCRGWKANPQRPSAARPLAIRPAPTNSYHTYEWVISHVWHLIETIAGVPCILVCCSVLQCAAMCCSVLQCAAVCCSVLQCVAVCCSVLQCVAVCCSVLSYILYVERCVCCTSTVSQLHLRIL